MRAQAVLPGNRLFAGATPMRCTSDGACVG